MLHHRVLFSLMSPFEDLHNLFSGLYFMTIRERAKSSNGGHVMEKDKVVKITLGRWLRDSPTDVHVINVCVWLSL